MTLYTEEKRNSYEKLDEELEETPEPMSKIRVVLMNMTQFGMNFMVLLLCVEIIPAQVQALVGSSAKGSCFGAMVAGGAAVTFFVSPIFGMISDRLRLKMGRRRPVIIVGTLFLCVGLTGMAFSCSEVVVSSNGSQWNNTNASDVSECSQDLVKKRCLPYENNSLPHSAFTSVKGGAIILANKNGVINIPTEVTYGNLAIQIIFVKSVVGSILFSMGYFSVPSVLHNRFIKGRGVMFCLWKSLFIVFFLIVITAQTAVSVPFNTLVADKSHPSQRGFNSGVMGAMILLGNVAGAAVGLSFSSIGVLGIYGCILAVLLVSITITIISTSEHLPKVDENQEPLGCRLIFCGFWEPLKEHDFRWVFITRFLMQQGVSTVTGFLEYWLDDMVQLPNCWTATTSVAMMMLPMLGAAAVSSVVFGTISDKTGRRKIIVTYAAFVMGSGALVDAFIGHGGSSAYYVAIVMAFIFGIGFGSFQSVDFALVMDVLPKEKDKAKDIAVWHLALILPQAVATPIGGVVLDLFERVNCEIGLGYMIVFLVTAVYFLLSGLFVYKIRRAN